jgi:threonine dehydrogenase-like Zn-dependent dehydrogenase
MKANIAFLHGPNDLRIEQVEVPKLRSDQVLVRPKAVGICGSDVECYLGHSAEGRYDIAPYTPGHEWSGEIVDLGSDVTTLQVGDQVTSDCVLPDHVSREAKWGRMPSAVPNFREVGFRPDSPGAMGEYMVIEEEFAHRFPDDWSFEEGAWIENFSVGYFGLWGNDGWVDASDDVVIIGAGPVGFSALAVAKSAGAKAIVVEPIAERRKKADGFGADVTIDPGAGDLSDRIFAETDGAGASVVVECSGTDAGIASCFDIAGHSGRLRFIGHSIGRKVPAELGKVIWKTLSITGAGGTKNFMPRTIKFMSRVRDEFDMTKLISHRYPFEQIHEAFKTAIEQPQQALKVMLHLD